MAQDFGQNIHNIDFSFFFPAPAVWHCRPRQLGSHTELGGRLACCLSTAQKENRWRFAHSPERHLSCCSRDTGGPSARRWYAESFQEDGWQGGVAGLGQGHSKANCLSFTGRHWWTLEDRYSAYWTRQVICTSRSSHCFGPGMQTILNWRDKHPQTLLI